MDESLPPPSTPLLAALWDEHRDSALTLIAVGADVNVADRREVGHGWTPLHFVAAAGDTELVRALLAAGAVVDARSVVGQTPLWWACNNGCEAATRELLAAGADPNARCAHGYSPLGRVLRSDAALVELLRTHGGVV